jgi:trehalose-phosphatase
MTHNIDQALDRLLTASRAGRTLAILLDYDGTLVTIVEHPRLAVLAPDTRDLLRNLTVLPRVVVGIVSGRSLDDLKSMVGLPGLSYVGTSGLEYELNGVRFAKGDSHEVRELLARVTERLATIAQSNPGAWLEPKPLGVTLHYREVAAERLPELRARADSILTRFDGDLRVTDGPMALEITPDLGCTKGTAVRWLCTQLGNDVTPVYVGDHANDADALATAAALGGVPIGVGPDAPLSAEHRLADPAALVMLLRRLLDCLTCAKPQATVRT